MSMSPTTHDGPASSSGAVRQTSSRNVTKKYGKNACIRCRIAKVRCEGRPTCERCIMSGLECLRGPDIRKIISKDEEKSMRHQNEVLKAQVDNLGSTVDSLNAEIDALRAQLAASSVTARSEAPSTSASLLQAQASRQTFLTPRTAPSCNISNASDEDEDDDADIPVSESEYESDGTYLLEQGMARLDGRRDLFREYGQLHLYGLTSPFRLYLRRSRSQPSIRFRREESPARSERHVLILPDFPEDEILPHCACETPCWAKYLPADVSMTRQEHDLLLDRFFLFYTGWCLRVIPEFFLRDMFTHTHPTTSPKPTTTHYSPFLHLCIMAVATAFSDDPRISDVKVRQRFVDEAKLFVEQECGHPSISAVQALSMLGSFYSGLGKQTLGFVYFGMSARLSQALGLGSDCAHWVQKGRIRSRDLFDRYWAFHMECAQDACWALYVGREFGIPSGQNEILSLADLADPILDTMSWRRFGGEPQQCLTFSTFIWSCALMKISRRIMTLMALLGQPEARDQTALLVAEIDMQLSTWREDLPSTLKLTPASKKSSLPAKYMMHLAFCWLMILLHRPFIRRRRTSNVNYRFSAERCNLAAKEILSILHYWKALYGTIRFAPITLIQVIFSAGTVFLLMAHQASIGRRIADQKQGLALDKVLEVIGFLKELGRTWQGATKIADIFQKLHDVQRQRMTEVSEFVQTKKAEKTSRRHKSVSAEGPSVSIGRGRAPSTHELALPTTPSVEIVEEIPHSSNLNTVLQDYHPGSLPSTVIEGGGLQAHLSVPAADSDIGSLSDEPSYSGAFSSQDFQWSDQEMNDTFDIFFNPQAGQAGSSVFDITGTQWGMPNGDTFPDLPFMALDIPGSQLPIGNFGMNQTDASGLAFDYPVDPFAAVAESPLQSHPHSLSGGVPDLPSHHGHNQGHYANSSFHNTKVDELEDGPLYAVIAAMSNGDQSCNPYSSY